MSQDGDRHSGFPDEVAGSGARVRPRSRALALPFGTTPLDSEEGRAFLQQRLALFANITFLIGSFALVASLLLHLGVPGKLRWVLLEREGIGWHLLGVTASFAAWLLARRGRFIYGLRAQVVQAQRLGQYVLDELIGEGGMGIVYKARHALLRRPTAIKLLLPERAGAHMLRRFEREVQLTALLTHPNTVNVYDYGRTADGTFYYAMEFLDGINLEQLVNEFGPQDSRRVVHILEQVAGSLSEAHGVGLVHRDIKPANVILCNRGGLPDIAKVVDFGLVKDANELGHGDPSLTSVNAIIGTPLYLAPEGILSPDKVDGRSDIYALGAIGYFLLTGQPVFAGATVIEVCVQHVNAEPVVPSTRLGKPVPQALEALVLRCLAKRPEDRPQSALMFLAELASTNIPPWPREQAAGWWDRHATELSRIKQAKHHHAASTDVRDTVIVDILERTKRARHHLPH